MVNKEKKLLKGYDKVVTDRRTNNEIRKAILYSLKNHKKSIHEIAVDSKVNWRTVELHLTFLKGKEYVIEVFRHHQLRIFEITINGRKELNKQ